MKENIGSRMFYAACAAMGILAGFSSWSLMEQRNIKQEQYNKNYTKDNTLTFDMEDGVFPFLLQIKQNGKFLEEPAAEDKEENKIEAEDKKEIQESKKERFVESIEDAEKLFVSGEEIGKSKENLIVPGEEKIREGKENLPVSGEEEIRESKENLLVSGEEEIKESKENLIVLGEKITRAVEEEMEKTVSAGVTVVPMPTVPLALSDTIKQVEFQQGDVQKNLDTTGKSTESGSMELKNSATAGNTESTEFSTVSEESGTTLSYPSEILGQTPKINRSDAYVTYFEFALDLVETIQPIIKEKELNEISLFTQFVMRALVYGVDVLGLNINEPISRAEAALTLWLAADILDEQGSNTSSKSAGKYVTDIKNCSKTEKKSVAYLYEQGILPGYQIAGQKFCPREYLKTTDGEQWMKKIQQCWK